MYVRIFIIELLDTMLQSLEFYLLLLLKVFLYEHGLQPSQFRGIFGILMLLHAFREYL